MTTEHSMSSSGSELLDASSVESAPAIAAVPEFTEEQLSNLKIAMRERQSRSGMEHLGINVLIVEDQEFSRQLLRGVFTRQVYEFIFHVAKNGQEAINKYAEIAPDIAYLDIELPDFNGHQLAQLFNKHDPKAFIVMVTANNYPKDVETAVANQVKSFIVKPYSKQKIMEAVDIFFKSKKKPKRYVCNNPLI